MTLVQLVIAPGILFALLVIFAGWMIWRVARAAVMKLRAERMAAELPVKLLKEQGELIAQVIGTVTSEAGFPEALLNQLMNTHEKYREVTRKK